MDVSQARWFKSSRSGTQTNCVEVAFEAAAVGVRDSKDREGPVLVLGPAAWHAFTATLKTGTLDVPAA